VSLVAVTLNILLGGEERFDHLLESIARWQPDLLVLQECLGWEDGARLSAVARALDVPGVPEHTHLGLARPRGSGRRFHVAVVSRRPLKRVVDHADPSLVGHCVVQCEIASTAGEPITVFGAHFDSHGEDQRLREADLVVELSAPLRRRGELALLLGDLNALSRRDPYTSDFADLVARAGTDKYGHPPRFEVIDAIERAGWVDALYAAAPAPAWVTAPRERGGVAIDYRTDYVFSSPTMTGKLVDARVLSVGGASDHDAVAATFDV
jgi:exodeoxyribonuclease-3